MIESKNKNVLTLAYLGDAIYEVYVRKYLIDKGIVKVNDLQKEAIKYVSAKNQRIFLENLLNQNLLTDIELELVYRARNHKGTRHPKNTDIVTYKYATAFETLIGYLYLEDNKKLDTIINTILN